MTQSRTEHASAAEIGDRHLNRPGFFSAAQVAWLALFGLLAAGAGFSCGGDKAATPPPSAPAGAGGSSPTAGAGGSTPSGMGGAGGGRAVDGPAAAVPAPCGGDGQTCCPGSAANECMAGLSCLEGAAGQPDRCGKCGALDQACCDSDCNTPDLVCVDQPAGRDKCVSCGASGQACCERDTCNTGLGCSEPPGAGAAGTCAACGAAGATCCPGSNCQSGSTCVGSMMGMGGTCQACGKAMQACCSNGLDCEMPLGCLRNAMGGTCGTCGGAGQPCCGSGGGGNCGAGLECAGRSGTANGTCEACGGNDQLCCSSGTECQGPLGCVETATGDRCRPCGAMGQTCCGTGEDGTCNMGLGCSGRFAANNGTCGACGAAQQACCTGSMPCTAAGNACVINAMGNRCAPCGAAGQACCGTGGEGDCEMGLGCMGRNDDTGVTGTCATCGGEGQPCCSDGPACSAGRRCVAETCRPCGAMGQPCCQGAGQAACQGSLVCSGSANSPNSTCGPPA
jgi:hypothetical protein